MLDTIPNEEEMTALVGKSLYDVWNKLCVFGVLLAGKEIFMWEQEHRKDEKERSLWKREKRLEMWKITKIS